MTRTPPARGPLTPAALAAVMLLGGALGGCAARVDATRQQVRAVTFSGLRAIAPEELNGRIATRETEVFPANRPSFFRWFRRWWVEPNYYDPGAVSRDRARIERYLHSRGYHAAEASRPVLTRDPRGAVSVEFPVFEGMPTRVADVRIRGCEEGDAELGDEACARIRERLELRVGSVFDEAAFARDREQVLEFTREAGFAGAAVSSDSMVDPSQRLAWIEYTVRPGAPTRFGRVRLRVPPSREEVRGDALPDGLPTGPVRSAMAIEEGGRYARSTVARAQQALFNLDVFGIARVTESLRPRQGVVDLDVSLSPARRWRFRLGAGGEVDTSRSNVHALLSFDHRSFLGGMRRLRIDLRPQLFAPGFGSGGSSVFEPGVVSSVEFTQPELSRRLAGTIGLGFEIGPDPQNPQVAYRQVLRGSLGFLASLTPAITGTASLRFQSLTMCPFRGSLFAETDCGQRVGMASLIALDPILRQQFFDRAYVYLDQTLTWDRRDNPVSPTRGAMLTLSLAEGTRSMLSDYAFLRVRVDGRGFVPLRRGLTLAVRGAFGVILGSPVECQSATTNGMTRSDLGCGASGDQQNPDRWFWPVPPELRFFSGGSQSNRGYPIGLVGLTGASVTPTPLGGVDSTSAVVAIGGTAMWEFSTELRWQPGALGLVLFFDAGNVTGIDPVPFFAPVGVNGAPAQLPPNRSTAVACPTTPTNAVADYGSCGVVANDGYNVRIPSAPPPMPAGRALTSLIDFSSWDAFVQSVHPSVGLGLRYQTPIGPLRLDVGVRLADLSCSLAARQVQTQNAAVRSNVPTYYVLGTPRCDFFGANTVPATIHFSIGEAY